MTCICTLPCSGVFLTHHTEVIDGLRHIVIEVLFDEQKLQNYVRSTNKNIQKALQLSEWAGRRVLL